MKFLSKIFLIYFLFFISLASAEIDISTWDENITLTKDGKESEIRIQAKVSGLEKGYFHNSYSFTFSPSQKITIKKVMFDNSYAKYSFDNNKLVINFNKAKKSGDSLTIYFLYKEKYDEIYEFLRQERIYVPSFAKGAYARVYISFPWEYESATLNKNVVKIGNGYRYNGEVPKDGVNEVIKLTLSQNIWDVEMYDNVISNSSVGDAELSVPKYFKDGGQRIMGNLTVSTPKENSISSSGNYDIFFYKKLLDPKVNVVTKARVYTGLHNRSPINRDPQKYLKVNPKETAILMPILEQIRRDPKLNNLPLYAKIGKFVNEYIHYDRSYIGKVLSIEEIVAGKTGVCIEYAKLFDSLARLANIPSLVVYGAAYGEYKKFEGHAWNLIYHNNQWIYVDPTWNLMSGIVSSSHIYFNDDSANSVQVRYYKSNGELTVAKDFKISRLQ